MNCDLHLRPLSREFSVGVGIAGTGSVSELLILVMRLFMLFPDVHSKYTNDIPDKSLRQDNLEKCFNLNVRICLVIYLRNIWSFEVLLTKIFSRIMTMVRISRSVTKLL